MFESRQNRESIPSGELSGLKPPAVSELLNGLDQGLTQLTHTLETVHHPEVAVLVRASYEQLKDLWQNQHEQLLSKLSQLGDSIGFVGLHGRPQESLEQILQQRTSSSRSVKKGIYVATNKFLGHTTEERLNDLYGIAGAPIAYCIPNSEQRALGQSTPGGILVANLGAGEKRPIYDTRVLPGVDTRAQYKNEMSGEETKSKGETTIGFNPENFSSIVKGIVPAAAWKNYHDAQEHLAMSENAKKDPCYYQRHSALDELMRQSVVNEVLKLFGSS